MNAMILIIALAGANWETKEVTTLSQRIASIDKEVQDLKDRVAALEAKRTPITSNASARCGNPSCTCEPCQCPAQAVSSGFSRPRTVTRYRTVTRAKYCNGRQCGFETVRVPYQVSSQPVQQVVDDGYWSSSMIESSPVLISSPTPVRWKRGLFGRWRLR